MTRPMLPVPPELSADNLFTAARRLARSIRIDEEHGGLLSTETVKASEHLQRHLRAEEQRIKEEYDNNLGGSLAGATCGLRKSR